MSYTMFDMCSFYICVKVKFLTFRKLLFDGDSGYIFFPGLK